MSGIPALFAHRRSDAVQRFVAVGLLAGCGLGVAAITQFLIGGASAPLSLQSPIAAARFTIEIDAISVVFLVPILLVSAGAVVYGLSYWKQSEHEENGRRLSFWLGLLTAAMMLLVAARDGILFLLAWEVMAVSAYFCISVEDEDANTRQASWLYLSASHLATLCLFGVFALMAAATGTFGFVSLTGVSPALMNVMFLLALIGFGTKAGIMPMHIWLPGAHAQAPSHVSAIMSGVVIKMGIYGLVRMVSLVDVPPVWWGVVLLTLGVISGVLGVAFAIGQHDIKRLLAYHSIENIGIIVMGLGLAVLGRSLGRPDWVVLGMAGALLHVWNHATFKSLLFFSAGSVIHATHTREIDQLGGLQKTMPATAFFFLIGAVAICGLPPLNGFVSELFIYLGLFQSLAVESKASFAAAAFAAPALALIGGLAVACFVKVYGTVFLGAGRGEHVQHAHEASLSMTGPMAVLAAVCVLIGMAPRLVAPLLQQAVNIWTGKVVPEVYQLASVAPLGWISVGAATLVGLLAVIGLVLHWRLIAAERATSLTWDCGYAAPSPRMQYTSSSFAEMLVDLFRWALIPQKHAPRVRALFPDDKEFYSHTPDIVLDRVVRPIVAFLYRVFFFFRYMQQGNMQAYLLYILVMLVVLLMWR